WLLREAGKGGQDEDSDSSRITAQHAISSWDSTGGGGEATQAPLPPPMGAIIAVAGRGGLPPRFFPRQAWGGPIGLPFFFPSCRIDCWPLCNCTDWTHTRGDSALGSELAGLVPPRFSRSFAASVDVIAPSKAWERRKGCKDVL